MTYSSTAQLFRRSSAIIGCTLLLCCFILIIAHKPYDRSVFYITTNTYSVSLLSLYTSSFADLALQIFGYAALYPIVFGIIALLKFAYDMPLSYMLIRSSCIFWVIAALSMVCARLECEAMPSCGGFTGLFLLQEFSYMVDSVVILLISILAVALLPIQVKEWYRFAKFIALKIAKTVKYLLVYLLLALKSLLLYAKKLTHYIQQQIQFKKHSTTALEKNIDIDDSILQINDFQITSENSNSHNSTNEYNSEFTHAITQDYSNSRPGKQITISTKHIDSATEQHLSSTTFILPNTKLLSCHKAEQGINTIPTRQLEESSAQLVSVLKDFGVSGDITNVRTGPVVTLFELEPAAGTKSSRVIGLADDIARSMIANSARISVISGKNALGIELPNKKRMKVMMRELLESNKYSHCNANLPLILGKDIAGDAIIHDLAKMPHLLVAGTTGSGKSVAINTMILSLLYTLTPKECRFIMIDPKMLELSVYDGIPHLLSPVVTNPKKAIASLNWVVMEMERRYKAMSVLSVRNIYGYNQLIQDAKQAGVELTKKIQVGFDDESGNPIYETMNFGNEILPFIVVIVDEMADLMLVAGKDIEGYIQRLSQMARAAGIHLIMATQRPSVDVITGVIKANFPTRISFQVTSKIDSRTILGEQGAEQLLGMGDMLFMSGGGKIQRVHGPFVSDEEVVRVVNHLKAQGMPEHVEELMEELTNAPTNDSNSGSSPHISSAYSDGSYGNDDEELYNQAVEIVLRDSRTSISYVQRSLKIGYNRAANIIEKMEKNGILTAPNSQGKRLIASD